MNKVPSDQGWLKNRTEVELNNVSRSPGRSFIEHGTHC